MSNEQETMKFDNSGPDEDRKSHTSECEGSAESQASKSEETAPLRKISAEDLQEFVDVIGGARIATEQAALARQQADNMVNAMRDAEAEVRYVGRRLSKKYGIDVEKDLIDIATGEIRAK